MPEKLKIKLPDITDDISIMPNKWLQNVTDAAFGDGDKCNTQQFFFRAGFMAALALLSDADQADIPIKQFVERIFKIAEVDVIGDFLEAILGGKNE